MVKNGEKLSDYLKNYQSDEQSNELVLYLEELINAIRKFLMCHARFLYWIAAYGIPTANASTYI